MTGYGKTFLMVAAAAVTVASAASAAPVSYTTTGAFGAGGSSFNLVDSGGVQSTLSFTGGAFFIADDGAPGALPAVGSLGEFALNANPGGTSLASLIGQTFAITLTQTQPVFGVRATSATFTGTFIYERGTIDASDIRLSFAPATFTIFGGIGGRNINYSIINPSNVPGEVLVGISSSAGTPAPAPLPSAAIAGGVLLSGFGAVRRLRKVAAV